MNGLSGIDVDSLIEQLKHAIRQDWCRHEAAMELENIINAINRLRQSDTTQASRPDRVGDECWYSDWNNDSRYVWRRGILRAWLAGDDFAIIEDCETGRVQYKSEISFSAEAPK